MNESKIVFRVDSSRDVGFGHVMRCLSLAEALTALGDRCTFLCAPAPGDLIGEIGRRGHDVIEMPSISSKLTGAEVSDAHATEKAISELAVDWLIVDHYGLGIEWERAVGALARNLLVIDDIGRDHECTLLLDQNITNPMHDRYRRNLSDGKLLLGPKYALLRTDFAAFRDAALRRRTGALVRLLVSMGGSDTSNATAKALTALEAIWRPEWHVNVVVGASNPHRESIKLSCSLLPSATLHVQASNMAELMTMADFAIGAGGSTTWERCCLGLPSLVSILSSDQTCIATAVANAGAQLVVGYEHEATAANYALKVEALTPARLVAMSASASGICDGLGASRVAQRLQ